MTWPPWGLLWSVMKHLKESKGVGSSPVKLNHTKCFFFFWLVRLWETNDLYYIFLSFKISGCFSCWLETGLHVNKLCKTFKCTAWKAQHYQVCEKVCPAWGWKHIKAVLLLWPQIRAVNVATGQMYCVLSMLPSLPSPHSSLRLKMEGSY